MSFSEELNVHQRDGQLDWEYLADSAKARGGDTLTILDLSDLGTRTVRAALMLATLSKRGVRIDCTAICDEPIQLLGMHAEWVRKSKSRAMVAAKKQPGANKGGRPKTPESKIRQIHEEIRAGKLGRSEIQAVHGVADRTMYDRCAELGLAWPVTVVDSSQPLPQDSECICGGTCVKCSLQREISNV